MPIQKATLEGVLCLFGEGGKLVAIVRKNGHPVWFKVDEMTFGEMTNLFGADNIQAK